ncbi:hypothetical protein EUAN_06780 [Andreesenia angusta]|uniref:DUF6273 domain-containing protein n=1 Tax=Andreesenia angusta TaxID=39480 RepID=A0A1S1V8R5_9FIRM|nr:DUF6273 domain-containing protein [Andreesenia angusta]OHW62894.1 hypothetical protein EUAN_06780 [Andreesenia angusta]
MPQLISALPTGSKVKFGRYSIESSAIEDIIWKIADKNHVGYPANSVTLITDKIIDLRGFDAKEPSNANADRKSYGNNRYSHSNLRQWLNKAGKPWYAAAHATDATPNDTGMSEATGYDDINGFLSSFSADELGVMMDTTLTVAKNTVTDGGSTETVVDKVFLASVTEVGLANETGGAEGTLLPIFSNDASRIATATNQAVANTLSTSKPATGAAWHWWLRSPSSAYSSNVRNVSTSGALDSYFACNGHYGLRPLCNLKSDILVSDTPDADGAYTVVFTNVISTNLATTDKLNFTWTVGTIGTHAAVKSQLHIYDNLGSLIKTGAIQEGIGAKSEKLIPSAAGNYKAKVKLWSDVTAENWSNEISYTLDVLRYAITLDKPITISAGEELQKIEINAKQGGVAMDLQSIDHEKLVYKANTPNSTVADIEIEGKDAKIDKIAYTVN